MCFFRTLLIIALVVPCGYAQTINNFFGETNGAVYAIHTDNTYLYIGGDFSRVASATQLTGGGAVIDLATAALQQLPTIDGKIYAITKDASGGWVLGGDFNTFCRSMRAMGASERKSLLNDKHLHHSRFIFGLFIE